MRCIQDLKEYVKRGLKYRFVEDDAVFNRFNHSIGTGAKKSQLLIGILSNKIPDGCTKDSYDEYFDCAFDELRHKLGSIDKKDLIAEEVISYMHDCMHLPFSHLFESAIIGRKGFHEELLVESFKEDNVVQIFNRISPNLSKVIEKHLKENAFSSLNASSLDLDRFDYILRGAYFKNDLLDCTNFPAFTFEEVNINGKKEILPVFNIDEYDNIIEILKYRNNLYCGNLGYLSHQVILADAVFGIVLKYILQAPNNCENAESDSKIKNFEKLKGFINSFSPQSNTQTVASDISLQSVLKWDCVNFINCVLDYAESLDEKTDSQTIKLIALMIPPLKSLMYMISYMKCDGYNKINNEDPEYIKARKEEDQKLIKRLKEYINSDTMLAKFLRDENFFFDNIEYVQNPNEKDLSKVDETRTFCENRFYIDYGEPIYIKLESGDICTIDKVPGKEFPLSTDLMVFSFVYTIKPLCQEKSISYSSEKKSDDKMVIPQNRFRSTVQETFPEAFERAS